MNTVYMIPLEDLTQDGGHDDLLAPGGDVDHVDIHYNAGHPGVEMPHAHIILWHVSADEEAWVAEFLHAQSEVVEILMRGLGGGAAVWFDPISVRVESGATVRWTNRDRSNVHTATTYHPSLGGRQDRILEAAEPWDSGPLLLDETFSVILRVPRVYDYFCAPHERAGMGSGGSLSVRGTPNRRRRPRVSRLRRQRSRRFRW